ncbi:ABC transporter substrate-binding protein [Rhodococcus sp. X156]|uniref:ABC transporter substrate-binding protein n=1 Tax=Rhodococcus sp. X156 TaxID=2499145 RepID=UPI0019CF4D7E|nr:ABC transporter substrate-binding protein [Rhodococcus sp. X156]
MSPSRTRGSLVAALSAGLLLLAGCGAGVGGESASAVEGYPLTVRNCGAEVTLDAPPERVVMLKSSAVPYLHALGLLDKVVARAGAYPAEYYDEATRAELDKIPLLTDKTDTAGHLQISKEVVIAQEPDLVLGEIDNLNRDTLAAAGIPLLEEPAMCAEGVRNPSFDEVYRQMTFYADVFDVPDRGAAAAAGLAERVRTLTASVDASTQRTAAVLYPTVGAAPPTPTAPAAWPSRSWRRPGCATSSPTSTSAPSR